MHRLFQIGPLTRLGGLNLLDKYALHLPSTANFISHNEAVNLINKAP